jgi:hypothetical protein
LLSDAIAGSRAMPLFAPGLTATGRGRRGLNRFVELSQILHLLGDHVAVDVLQHA